MKSAGISVTASTFLLAAAILCACLPAKAGVLLTGDVTDGTGVLSLRKPLLFEITSTTQINFLALVFEGWGSPDDVTQARAFTSSLFTFQLNSDATRPAFTGNFFDTVVGTAGDVTPGDAFLLLFGLFPPRFSLGDTLRIDPFSAAIRASSAFSPLSSRFSGSVFLIDGQGTKLSTDVSVGVSAPVTFWLVTCGLLFLRLLGAGTLRGARNSKPIK